MTAIDPRGGNGVLQVALEDLEAAPRSFDAAVAMVSLHHVVPLGQSLRRLSEVLRHGARLVVDEFAIERFDERAAGLVAASFRPRQAPRRPCRRDARAPALRRADRGGAGPVVRRHEAVPCAYMYRWKIDPALRDEEERLIASGELPAVGTRFIAVRR